MQDLGALYSGSHDPGLDRDLERAGKRADALRSSYRGRFPANPPEPSELLHALRAYEAVHEAASGPRLFAYLYRASNTRDQGGAVLFQRVREAWHAISQKLAFLPLDLMSLDENLMRSLADSPVLSGYRHFLLRLLGAKPHAWSEPEQRIAGHKDLSGREAWLSLYLEFVGSLSIRLEIDGKLQWLSADETLALQQSPNRLLREKGLQSFMDELGRHRLIFRSALNALTLDYYLESTERGYGSTVQQMLHQDEADPALLGLMTEVVEEYYPLARRYFRLKADLLGLQRIRISDLPAPLAAEGPAVPFEEAKGILLAAMDSLHPSLYSAAAGVLAGGRIDAEPRAGKQQGAFCKCLAPSQRPYIVMSYRGTIRDMLVLAHEFGHGLHCALSSGQTYLNFKPSPLLMETASTLCEILCSAYLLGRSQDRSHRVSLLAGRLEGMMTTVFRQNVLTRFELALHARRQDHPLEDEEICQLWWDEHQRLYGDTVEVSPA